MNWTKLDLNDYKSRRLQADEKNTYQFLLLKVWPLLSGTRKLQDLDEEKTKYNTGKKKQLEFKQASNK